MDGNDNFDYCQCVSIINNVLETLRRSQAYCTYSECFENELPSTPGGAANNFVLMFAVAVVVVFFYVLRPRRGTIRDTIKPKKVGDNDFNDPPPTPPSV